MRLSEALPKVEGQLTTVGSGHGAFRIIAIKEDGPGYGVVLVQQGDDEDAYITWKWATLDTAGELITTPTGAMLYSGHYDMTRDEGVLDFEARA